jgi:predicted nucleic acid-binding protein
MIAADSSSMLAFFAGDEGTDVEGISRALAFGELALPPPVLSELLTGTLAPEASLLTVPLLDLLPGYWARTGKTRRVLRQRGLRANIGDSLVAQACIDNDVALITRDAHFRHFAAHCGLKLA